MQKMGEDCMELERSLKEIPELEDGWEPEDAEETAEDPGGQAGPRFFEWTVEETEEEMRIDRYLSDRFPELTRSYVQRMIKEGAVLVNGAGVKSSYRVAGGDKVFLMRPEPTVLSIRPEPIPLEVLYEDQDLLIVNKPKGMVVHPAAGHYSGTLVNAVLYHCGDSLSGINGVLRPGIVHRIDRDTTGSLIVCKNDRAHQCIAGQLKEHSITRKYRALVHGRLSADGTVHAAIGRHPQNRKQMAANVPNGKDAVTHYHILEQFDGYTYVECQLETGRTHQIRVHMKSIGHPLVGDQVYGPSRCPFPGLQGQTLHAMTIGFRHPSTGAYLEFDAPLPEYFEELLRKLRNHTA